ncbi:hypothetical protein HYH02_000058 [Chlamydomonas schloesseri]|uniref:Flavin-containing monooxygenase n=1 Tax=Chlamydomonas schloesseri TaxID=2026947 RepID=A0A835WLI6_9CHLO|nr:hypothetical protein HYH02_000058 [Chlamydomonas schloesseri]|eukprot:KAG2449954.1 hypothetical protein HYH02_000058 [Chlamydomonas schloesseri]
MARQLLKIGLQVMVLEGDSDIGGVWSQNHYGCKLQTPWRQYQFPEFLWPVELQPDEEYPTAEQVRSYVWAYARHFDLVPLIRLNCKLLRLRWAEGNRSWDCLYADTAAEKFFKTRVDYVVVCSGIFSNPYIPTYPGASDFVGQQIHAKHFHDVSVASGRRVLIVGAGKTGMDAAAGLLAGRAAASVTMLYRQAHWPIPKRVLGLSTRTLFFSRLGAATLPPYYTAGRLRTAVAAVTKPLRALFWKGMQAAIASRFHATRAAPPSLSLPSDLFYGGQVLDDSLERLARTQGALEAIRGEVNRFVRNGVILQDGSFHAADVVLYCTGYAKTYDFFDGEMRARLGLQKDGLYLYRNCLPPGVPQLAFVGSEVSTYSNIVTSGLQALWLAHVLAGRVALPPAAAMEQDVRAQQVWKREVMPAQRNRSSVLLSYQTNYHDQLLSDMRMKPRRKGANLLSECFGAYTAADYSPLLCKRDAELAAAVEQAAAAAKAAQAAAKAGAAIARAQQQRLQHQQRQPQHQQQERHANVAIGRSLYPAQLRAAAAAATAAAAAAEGAPAQHLSADTSSNCDADDEHSVEDGVRSVVAAALAAAAAAMEGGRNGGYGGYGSSSRSCLRASGASGDDNSADGGGAGNWTAYPTAGASFTSEAAFHSAKAAGMSGYHGQHPCGDSLESVTASATAAAVEAAVAAALAATAHSSSHTTRRSSAAAPADQDPHNTWPFTSLEGDWQEGSSRFEEGASATGYASAAGAARAGDALEAPLESVRAAPDGVSAAAGQPGQPWRNASGTAEAAADCASPSEGTSAAAAAKSSSMSLLRKLMHLRSSPSRREPASSAAAPSMATPASQQEQQADQSPAAPRAHQEVQMQLAARKLQIRIPSNRSSSELPPEAIGRSLESISRSGLSATAAAAAAAAAMGAVTLVINSTTSQGGRMWDSPSSPRAGSATTTATGFLSAPSSKRGMARSNVETRSMRGSAAAVAAAAAAALAAATTVANMQSAGFERVTAGGSGGASGVASARSSTHGNGTPGGSVHGAASYRSHRLSAQSSELVAAATATALRRLSRRASITAAAADEQPADAAGSDEQPAASPRYVVQFQPAATAAPAFQEPQAEEHLLRCSITYSGSLPAVGSGALAAPAVQTCGGYIDDMHRCADQPQQQQQQLAIGSYSIGPGMSVEKSASLCHDEVASWHEVMTAESAAASVIADPIPILPGSNGRAAISIDGSGHFDCSWRQRGGSAGGGRGCGGGSSQRGSLLAAAVPGSSGGGGASLPPSGPVSPPLLVVGGSSGSASASSSHEPVSGACWYGSPGTPPLARSRSHLARVACNSAGGCGSAGGSSGTAHAIPMASGGSAYRALMHEGDADHSGFASAGSNGGGGGGLLSATAGDSGALSSAPGSITLNGGMFRLSGASVHRGPGPLSPLLPSLHQHAHQHRHYGDHRQLHHHHHHHHHQPHQGFTQYRSQQHQQQQQQQKHATAMLVESLMGLGVASSSHISGGAASSGASPPPSLMLLAHRRRHSALDPMPLSTALETLSEEDASVTPTATPSFCGGVVVASETRPRSSGGATGCDDCSSPSPIGADGGSASAPAHGSSDCLKVGVAAVHAARLLQVQQGSTQQPTADSAWLHTDLSTC